MPKISEDRFLLGFGIAFAIWVFGVLPFLYVVPRFEQYNNYQSKTAAPNANRPNDRPNISLAAQNQPLANQNANSHPGNQNAEDHNEFWSAKLTDWLLAIFNLLLVVFTGLLYRATAGLFTETAGLRQAAAEQSRDAKASIAEAARAAIAMENVSEQVAVSARAAQDSVNALKERTAAQMRAYLSVIIGIGIYQERDKDTKFEGKPVIINAGFTPAYNVRHWAKAAILAMPVPLDFPFPIGIFPEAGSLIGAQQNSMMSAITDDYVADDQIEDIKKGKGRALHIWGTVSYVDIFGEPHETEFCQCLTWLPNGTIYGIFLPHRNKAT
jgi:hypothetical protein